VELSGRRKMVDLLKLKQCWMVMAWEVEVFGLRHGVQLEKEGKPSRALTPVSDNISASILYGLLLLEQTNAQFAS